MSPAQFRFTWYQKCCRAFQNCVLAEIQLHPAESIVRDFQVYLSWNSIASYLKYSETFSTCVLAEIQLHPVEFSFKHFQFVCYPKINCIVPKLFWDILKLDHDRNSIASDRNCSKNFSNCLLAENHLQRTEFIVRHLQNVS